MFPKKSIFQILFTATIFEVVLKLFCGRRTILESLRVDKKVVYVRKTQIYQATKSSWSFR